MRQVSPLSREVRGNLYSLFGNSGFFSSLRMHARIELVSLMFLTTYWFVSSATTDGSRHLVFAGETAEIPCEIEGAVYTIYWKKGPDPSTAVTVASFVEGDRVGSDNGRITMSPSRALMIDDVVVGDEGRYYCEIQPTSTTERVVLDADLVVAVPPRQPFPILTLVQPSPPPPTSSSCHAIIAESTSVEITCQASGFRPSIEFRWRRDNATVAGSDLTYINSSDGTRNAYSSYEFTMGGSNVEILCEASGESVREGSEVHSAVICYTEESGGGGSDTTKIVIIVIIVLVLVAAVVGLVVWMRRLIKDTTVRANYTKSVSADDDTPSRTRMSNFCHICWAACCPCMTKRDPSYTETRGPRSSHAKEQPRKKPTAPSAALKARLQRNRKKQEEASTQQDTNQVPSERHAEESPMLEDAPRTSAHLEESQHENNKPPGARPKTRPAEDVSVVVGDQHTPHSKRWEEKAASGSEAETGF